MSGPHISMSRLVLNGLPYGAWGLSHMSSPFW